MWITGIPAARHASASRFTFSTTFCSFACSGAPESANAPPSIITSFCRSCTTSAARAGSTLICSLSLTASSSRHVAEPVAPDLYPDPVERGRARHVEIAPVVAAPVEIADVLRHLDHAEVLGLRADHPDAAGPGDVDVASLVALHPVGDSLLDHARADVVEEHPPVRDRAVRLPVENPDVGPRRVVDVQQRLVGREAKPVRLIKVVHEELRLAAAAGLEPVDALETELPLSLDAEDGHAAVPRVAEVDRAVVRHDHVVRAVQLLPLVVGREHLSAAARAVRVHAHERARDVFADEQPALRVVRHAVAFVARVRDLDDAFVLAPAPPDVARHVDDEEEASLLVPDRAFGAGEARPQLLDPRILVDEVEELLRLDVHGHLRLLCTRGAKRREPNTLEGARVPLGGLLLLDVDPALRVAQRTALPASAGREDLGEDRERRLGGRDRADVEPGRAGDALELSLVDTRLQQPLAPTLLVSAGAERADIERLCHQRAVDRRHIELVVVRQHDDSRLIIGLHLRERFLGPGDDQLIRTGDPLLRGELCSRVGDYRPPTEPLRERTQLLGGVDRPNHQQPRRRSVNLGKHLPPVIELEQLVATAAHQVVDVAGELVWPFTESLSRLGHQQLGAERLALDDGEQDCPLLGLEDLEQAPHKLVGCPVDEHVDLAAAGQPDREGEVVGDPVREQLRLRAAEHFARVAVDLALDAAAGDRPGHLPALRDGELGSDRPRGRAPRRDDRRERELLAARAPTLDVRQDLLHAACLLSIPASTPASSSRLARLCPAMNRSTYGRAARIPPASGSYSGFPLSGLTQTIAYAARCSLSISRATSVASCRSQPSDTITTTAPRVSARRPHTSLNVLRDGPIRVPLAQSTTRVAAAESACSGSRVLNSSVSRYSRVPNANTSTPRPEPTTACKKRSSARVYASIEPETSHRTTSLRGTSTRRRNARSMGSPPRPSERRASRRRSSRLPRACGRNRRERRSGRAAATSLSARAVRENSSAVIDAKSFLRSTSWTLHPTSVGSSPKCSPSSWASVRAFCCVLPARSAGCDPR